MLLVIQRLLSDEFLTHTHYSILHQCAFTTKNLVLIHQTLLLYQGKQCQIGSHQICVPEQSGLCNQHNQGKQIIDNV